jgi:hypothetical protein
MYTPRIMGREISAILLAMVLLMSVASLTVAMVGAQDSAELPTSAQVNLGNDPPPAVPWKWELPDDDLATPCTQIYPALESSRMIDVFAIVTDADGITDISLVYVQVLHPDGSVKYHQIDMVHITDTEIIEASKVAALASGKLTIEEVLEIDYMISEEIARMYWAQFELHYCQPAGIYTITVYAVDQSGNIGMLTNTDLYYVPVAAFRLDFTCVSFGDIKPCVEKIVPGDWDMATPDKPTIKNIGNIPIRIKVHFTEMIGTEFGKLIEDFDASFHPLVGTKEKLLLKACEWGIFNQCLELCHTEKLDFSVHAPLGTPTDSYTGLVHIAAEPCDQMPPEP